MVLSDEWDWLFQQGRDIFSATDYAGNKRTFKLSYSEIKHIGYNIYATENIEAEHKYEFKATSFVSPYEAYIKLINKIRNSLATRHLQKTERGYNLLCNTARGRIVVGGAVIDGQFLTWKEFTTKMESHEGWDFELHFKDGCE